MFSRTEKAAEARKAIIEVFRAHTRTSTPSSAQTLPAPKPAPGLRDLHIVRPAPGADFHVSFTMPGSCLPQVSAFLLQHA